MIHDIEMNTKKAARLRLRHSRMSIDIAIDAIERGWVNQQIDRVMNEIAAAKRDLKDAEALLKRGLRRAHKKDAEFFNRHRSPRSA